jgi:hypothetical protein
MSEQDQWHFCKKCAVMHFAPSKGPCVAGGEHEAQGFNFKLPHGIPEAPSPSATGAFAVNVTACSSVGIRDDASTVAAIEAKVLSTSFCRTASRRQASKGSGSFAKTAAS